MRILERSTIRTRLTVLYAAAFFLGGAILIGSIFFYLQQSLDRRPAGALALIQQFFDQRGVRRPPLLDELFTAISTQAEQARRDTLNAMLTWSLVCLCGVGVAAGGFGWLLAGRALQPLQDVTATARRVADRNLHERIALDGPHDEIKELADTFDAMLARLDVAFDVQRRFVANASHELRTPLAINRTLIEVFLDDPDVPAASRQLGETLLEVNRRHEHLIDGLLVLAGSDQQLEAHTRVDLGEVAHHAVATAARGAPQSGIRIDTDIEPAVVLGDSTLLERVAQNLIENAFRYNASEGGWIGVRVVTDGSTATFTVENAGPVIAASDVDRLFEPFRRLTDRVADRPGTRGAGLGLSIVRSVVTAHGGSVTVHPRRDGGLHVTVSLPADQ